MDSDYLYRLIVTVFVFIPSSCVIAYLWPRKYPQVRYEKPPLTPLPKKIEPPILVNEEKEIPLLEEDTVLDRLNNHMALTIYTKSEDIILNKTSPRNYTDYGNV